MNISPFAGGKSLPKETGVGSDRRGGYRTPQGSRAGTKRPTGAGTRAAGMTITLQRNKPEPAATWAGRREKPKNYSVLVQTGGKSVYLFYYADKAMQAYATLMSDTATER